MKLTKRLISLLICVLMVASVLPMGIFAEEGTTTVTSDFDISLPFDDIGSTGIGTYIVNKGSAYGITNKSSSYTATTGDDGNVYAYNASATGNGMISLTNSTGCANFAKPFMLSFRMKVDHRVDDQVNSKGQSINTLTTDLYLPVVRLMSSTASSTSGTGTLNMLVIGNGTYGKVDGSAVTGSTETGVVGELTAGVSSGTDKSKAGSTGYLIYADTWYDITLFYNPATGVAYFTATDGVNTCAYTWTISSTYMIDVNRIMLFRTYDAHDGLKYLDDVRVRNINMNFSASADMENLSFATGTNAETGDPETYTYPNMTPTLVGFSGSGASNDKWALIQETDEGGNVTNQYIQHVKNATASPITWEDQLGLIDGVPFEFSWDYKWGSVTATGAGMFSVKRETKIPSGGNETEIRIINALPGGKLYFGPGQVSSLQIGTLTTPESEGGAQWHNIKTVLIPYVTETHVDMLYRFYIDGELAAFTTVEDGSYNFYTNYTGEWTCAAGLQTAKYVEYEYVSGDTDKDGKLDSGETFEGDTNGNGTEDEGETFVYATAKKWISGTYGTDQNNTKRAPFGLWDGYEIVYLNGTTEKTNSDGAMDGIASIYMSHFNTGEFAYDNLLLNTLDAEEQNIENVDLVGYQVNADKTAVRFIAGIDSRNFGNVGMDVEVYEMTSETGWVMKADRKYSNETFVAISADGKNAAAVEYGANYFSLLTITDIDSSAIVRVSPYTTKAGVRTYGDPVVYSIIYTAGDGIAVNPVTTYVRDYDDGVVTNGNAWGNGYSTSTYAQLISPNGDWGSGGEGGSRSVTGVDGTMKFTVSDLYRYDDTTTNETKIKEWFYTYTTETVDEETQESVTTLHKVTDAEGNVIDKKTSMSARYKLANVIPTDYDELIGKTVIISAKIKVAEVSKSVKKTVVGYAGEITEANAAEYTTAEAVVDPNATADISIAFYEDVYWSAYGTAAAGNIRTYTLAASDEWVEVTAAIDITEELVASIRTKNDADGNPQPAPFRLTFSLGDTGGWASEMYVDDATCYVVPTIAE